MLAHTAPHEGASGADAIAVLGPSLYFWRRECCEARCGGSAENRESAMRSSGASRSTRHSLSYNDDAFIRQLYRRRGISFERISVPYTVIHGARQIARELLIRNF